MEKVLFVCVGNSCRSQMAEAFARAYGRDVLEAQSAGLYPARSVSRMTLEVMAEKALDLKGQYPKGLSEIELHDFDLVVNMSGFMLPEEVKGRVLHWEIPDPIGGKKETYRRVSADIEARIKDLIAALRGAPGNGSGEKR